MDQRGTPVGGRVNVVASGAARRCEVQVAYAIGVARPVSVMVETVGTEAVDPARIGTAVTGSLDLAGGGRHLAVLGAGLLVGVWWGRRTFTRSLTA